MIPKARRGGLIAGVLGAAVLTMVNIPAIGAQTDEVDTARQRVADLQAQQEELARALEDTWVAQVLAEERLAATEDALRQAESDLWLAQSSLEQWAVRLYMDLTTGKSVSLLMVESPERFEAGVGYLQAVGGDEEEILNHYRSVTQELARQQTEHQSHLVELDEIRGEQETLFSQLIESLEAAQQELALLEALDSEQTESVPTTTTTRPITTTTTTTTTRPTTTTTTTTRPTTTTTRPPTTTTTTTRPTTTTTTTTTRPTTTTTTTTTTTRPPTTTTTTTRPTTPTTRPSDGYDYNGVCPVDEPNTFVDTWGAPRSGGRTHQGVDLLAERGTPVRAIHEGVLFRVDVGGLGGLFIWLRAPWGDEYYYAHLEDFGPGIGTGKRVSQGDLIGYVGTSGNSPDYIPHLHFEYHPGGGRAVNPYPLALQACE
ncbi:MAG: peptidoglycan DD-metalloendopeptidase family protein [bacterium]|nr:peptidoglycan DD-metalloendopeptidase family protein [bacterium]